mmetsp:Transcript_24732/g.43577  ORF Transcript_24732/g.43577 Transcript_24732/m.43577 type:complete len:352 (-) Transcript_24732:30-1085(-)
MQDLPKLADLRKLMTGATNGLIDVDLDSTEMLGVEALLVESSSAITENPDFDRIYRRYPATSLSREIVDSRDDVGVTEDLEELNDWDVLAKTLIISSPKPFEWLNDFDSKTESEGILAASSGIESSRPAVQVYQASIYWECRTGPLWMEGLRSLFYMFLDNKCSRFYIYYGSYILLFTRKPKSCCMISNYKSILGATLRDGGVNIPEQSQEELKILGSKPASCVKITGNSLRALYNFLANSESEMRVVAPVPFLNSTMRSLKTTFNGEFSPPPEELSQTSAFRRKTQQEFRWALEGPITSATVKLLCKALEVYQEEFDVDLVSEAASKALNERCVSKVSFRRQRYRVSYFR